jgi:DNA-binding GntR family transcriptional regulator
MAKAAERAYSQIRSWLVAGDFGPGVKLREEDLALRTGVSRTPVREALRRLAAEGLVEFQAGRGVKVVSWTSRDLDEIFSLRALLEGYGAGQAAERAKPDDLDDLTALCDQMDTIAEQTYRAGPHINGELPESLQRAYAHLSELNNSFQKAVLNAADNAQLNVLMSGLVSAPLVQRTFMQYSDQRLARSMAHHRELVEALKAGDPAWATAVMTAHIRSARSELR